MEASHAKVLLVDDDPAALRLVGCWLEADGYEVTEACDGLQALAAIEKQCPDFLVTDWEMPNIDGIELCRRLRAMSLPHYVHILFLTGRSTTAEIVLGLEAGADDFLTKPVNRDELLARLRSGTRVMDLERRLSRMAHTDHLTGLLTRRTFFDMLAKEWQRSTRLHLPLSCVMMDIDFFKRVNDVHGHMIGDTVLKALGDLLKDTCRGSDSVCRFGGEEFCIMLPETDERQAMQWAERVRRRLAALTVPAGDREIHITGSFGTAGRHEDMQQPEELIDRADQALLCAKQSGRDR
ncbi:MAG: diguanylate cyclase, partial [Thermoguttaceae bacterium]